MALTVLSTLALMLQLMAVVLHLVAMATSGWLQLGVFLPVPLPLPTTAVPSSPSLSESNGAAAVGVGGNFSSLPVHSQTDASGSASPGPVLVAEAAGSPDQPVASGPTSWDGRWAEYVKVRLGLLEWCQQLHRVSPACQNPAFLPVVGVLAFLVLATLCFALIFLMFAARQSSGTHKQARVTSLVFSTLSGLLILAIVTIYSVLGQREANRMLAELGQQAQSPLLGWSLGVMAVSGIHVCIAAVLILRDLLRDHACVQRVPSDETKV